MENNINDVTEDFEIDYPVRYNKQTRKWETEKKKIVVKMMNYGEKNSLSETYMKMEIVGKIVTPRMSYKDMMENTILRGLKEAPFPLTIEGVRSIPTSSAGDAILKIVKDFNEMNDDEKKNFDGQLNTEQATKSYIQ